MAVEEVKVSISANRVGALAKRASELTEDHGGGGMAVTCENSPEDLATVRASVLEQAAELARQFRAEAQGTRKFKRGWMPE